MSIRKRFVVAHLNILNLNLTGKEDTTLGVLIEKCEGDIRNWYV
jgi:hypothetical protein